MMEAYLRRDLGLEGRCRVYFAVEKLDLRNVEPINCDTPRTEQKITGVKKTYRRLFFQRPQFAGYFRR